MTYQLISIIFCTKIWLMNYFSTFQPLKIKIPWNSKKKTINDPQTLKNDQNWSYNSENEAKRDQKGWFLHAGIFLWEEKIMFSNPGPQTKIGWAMGILLIPRFWSGSTRNSVSFLVLVRGNFFISSESLFIWLYFGWSLHG